MGKYIRYTFLAVVNNNPTHHWHRHWARKMGTVYSRGKNSVSCSRGPAGLCNPLSLLSNEWCT